MSSHKDFIIDSVRVLPYLRNQANKLTSLLLIFKVIRPVSFELKSVVLISTSLPVLSTTFNPVNNATFLNLSITLSSRLILDFDPFSFELLATTALRKFEFSGRASIIFVKFSLG